MMMGRGLQHVSQVPAGCVLAIAGLGKAILKSATLASSPMCFPLAPMLFQVSEHLRSLAILMLAGSVMLAVRSRDCTQRQEQHLCAPARACN